MSKCDLCGTEVKVVGHTTLHYEPVNTSLRELENKYEKLRAVVRVYEDALEAIKYSLVMERAEHEHNILNCSLDGDEMIMEHNINRCKKALEQGQALKGEK